jgi:hypothetical protein
MTTVTPPKLRLHKTEGPIAQPHRYNTHNPKEAVCSPSHALL